MKNTLPKRLDLEDLIGPLVRADSSIAEFNPTHWPPRPTRLALCIRLGIARMLLERAA